MESSSCNEGNPHHSDTEPMPDITWWMVLTSTISIILIGLAWWYMVPFAYDGFVNDLVRPFFSASPVVTVSSFYLTTPLLVLGLLAVFAMMVLIWLPAVSSGSLVYAMNSQGQKFPGSIVRFRPITDLPHCPVTSCCSTRAGSQLSRFSLMRNVLPWQSFGGNDA